MMRAGLLVAMFLTMPASIAVAQGQDSTPWERDLQVVGELIQGSFDNANQAYFDFRTGRETKHRRIHVDVERIDAPPVADVLIQIQEQLIVEREIMCALAQRVLVERNVERKEISTAQSKVLSVDPALLETEPVGQVRSASDALRDQRFLIHTFLAGLCTAWPICS